MATRTLPCTAPRTARGLALIGASLVALSLPEAALADGPKGGTVVGGAARIVDGPGRTTIRQTSRRAVIDWRSFDVGRGHQVTFDQPGRHAATLNRVQTARPSVIEGAIRAPGTVIIQNGAGVLFTGTARIDVGGLVAATPSIDAEAFQRIGRVRMSGGRAGARVENRGRITVGAAGLAALVGGQAENSGTIEARRGTVVLAGGTRGTIDLAGDGMVRIAVEGDGTVANAGRLDAEGGRVLLSAGAAAEALEAAINTSGVIRATSGSGRGGRIELAARGRGRVAVSGRLDASGAEAGGAIDVTGAAVDIGRGAVVTASGGTDGGSVRIGGDRQGTGTLRRAETATVAAGATIAAEGLAGRGGTVVVWSDGLTRFDGRAAARGGFVETSGLGALAVGSAARVEAAAWLLDPRNVLIADAAAGALPDGTQVVSRLALQAALDAGADVTVTTVQPGDMPGDITVAAPLSWTGTGDLRLEATRDILIDAAVTTRDGDFVADAGRWVEVGADLRGTGEAAIALAGDAVLLTELLPGDRTLTTQAGDLTLAGVNRVVIGRTDAHAGGLTVGSASGDVAITAGRRLFVRGGDAADQWVQFGSADSSSDIRIASRRIEVLAGPAEGSSTEIVTGAGGSLALSAGEMIVVRDRPSGGGTRVAAHDGAPLTIEAPEQIWNGTVAAVQGGDVRVSGRVTGYVPASFDLASGADFRFGDALASSFETTARLDVRTSGAGTVTIGAPVTGAAVSLVSEEQVALAAGAGITGTGGGDALVVSAGRRFENAAGAGAFALTGGGRWVLYLDAFDGFAGGLPGPRGFDLYDRTLASAPPAALGYGGNRVVYAAQPTLTLTAGSIRKTYGTAGAPGVTASGLRPGDSYATALSGAPSVASTGRAAGSAAGTHAAQVVANASRQGYALEFVDGAITVDRATLTVAANGAERLYGALDPAFDASFRGFVLGESPAVLGGALRFASAASRGSGVGSYAIAPSGLTSGNYDIRYEPGALVVRPAPLTISAVATRRTYGAANPAFAVSYAGFLRGDGPEGLAGRLGFATAATRGSGTGSYEVTPQGLRSANYAITYRGAALTVDPALLTVAALDAARSYGADDPAFGVRYGGFVLGDDAGRLGGRLVFASGATRLSPVGRYAVTPGGLMSANYAISYEAGILTVGAARFSSAQLIGRKGGVQAYRRGVEPLTPGDASFRTTAADAPPALSNTFGLSYSLGRFTELAPAGGAGAQGFVPASGGGAAAAADTAGFVPASGTLGGEARGFAPAAGGPAAPALERGCRGSVGLGPSGCGRRTVVENYWQAAR